jgi:hypothetical protein
LRFTYQGDSEHNAPDMKRFWETIAQAHWAGPTPMMVIHPAKSSQPVNLSNPVGGLSSQAQRSSTADAGSASPKVPGTEFDQRRYENDLFKQSLLSDVRASTQQALSQMSQTLQQSHRPPPPADDSTMKLVAVALPILKEFMTDARASREKAEERQMTLLAEFRKKPEADPLMQALVQKGLAEKPNEQMTQMLTVMGQGMAAMSQQVMQLMTFQMEMRQQMAPQETGGIWDVIGKAIDAWSLTVEKVGASAAEAGEQAAALPSGEEEQQPMEVDPIIAVEMAVRQQRSAQEVGEMLVAAMANAEFRTLLASYGNDVKAFVKARFGPWVAQEPESRLAYISSVLPQAVQYAITKGAFAKAPAAAQKIHQRPPAPPVAEAPKEVAVPLEAKRNGAAPKRRLKIQDEPSAPEANEAPPDAPPASA